MSRSTVGTALIWVALLALFGMQVAISVRLNRIQEQTGKSDERPAAGAVADRGGAGGEITNAGDTAKTPTENRAGGGTPAADAGSAPADDGNRMTAKGPAPRRAEGVMSESDIEALVERKLKEHDKNNPFKFLDMEDPVVVMERELKLSPIQKTRIMQHRKERDDAVMALWETEEGRKNFRETQEKVEELGKKCDESVKRELTLEQQDKYEELKKSGKLMDFAGGGGMSIVINRDEPVDEPAPGK